MGEKHHNIQNRSSFTLYKLLTTGMTFVSVSKNYKMDSNQNADNRENKGQETKVDSGSGSLQSKEEFEMDKGGRASDDKVSATGVDDLQSNSDGAAGTDRAGTAERKPYGDTPLNQGLEEQNG